MTSSVVSPRGARDVRATSLSVRPVAPFFSLLLAIATLVLPLARSGVNDPATGLAALLRATPDGRIVQARLSGGFRHSPMRSGATAPRHLSYQSSALLAASASAQQAALSDPSAARLHVWGLSQLLLGDYDGAVASLRAAAEDAGTDAKLFSDLAAALLSRAYLLDRPEDLPLALEAAEHARSLGDAPEIRYNRALALEALHLDRLAIAEWDAFLAADSSSGWAEEARQRMQALQDKPLNMAWAPGQAVAKETAFRAREWFHVEGLVDWARAAGAGEDASIAFSRIQGVASELSRVTGDHVFDAIVEDISSAKGHRLRLLAAGYGGLADTQSSRARPDNPANMIRHTAEACAALRSANSVVAPVCEVEQGFMRVEQRDFAGGLAAAERLLPLLKQRHFVVAEGRALWLWGRALTTLGEFSEAGDRFRLAEAPFEQAAEWPSVARMKSQRADMLWATGRQQEAWTLRLAALDTVAAVGEERLSVSVYSSTSAQCENERKPASAMAFAEAVLEPMDDREAPLVRSRFIALQQILVAAVELSDIDRAKMARDELQGILATRGEWGPLAINQDFQLALARLSEAEGNFAASDGQLTAVVSANLSERAQSSQLWAYLGRASVRIKQQRFSAAGSDLQSAASLLQGRTASQVVGLRSSDLGILRRLAAEIAFGDSAGDKHGLVVFDSARTTPIPNASVLDLANARQLPESTAILAFADNGARLGVWIISRTETSFVELGLHSREVRRLSRQAAVIATTSTPGANWSRTVRGLYAILLGPLHLSPFQRLVVVPDGTTANVPFDALESPAGEAVSARWTVSRATSVAAALSPSPISSQTSVLVIGDPANDLLDALPGARREAIEIAALYAGHAVTELLGEHATLSNVKSALASSSIVHFGGHAYPDPETPGRSYLQLAPEEGSNGRWTVDDMSVGQFSANQIVILAACQGAEDGGGSQDAVTNLAEAILRAGAGTVVASLWPLPDDASTAYFLKLHERLVAGDDPVAAAQSARAANFGAAASVTQQLVAGVQVFTRGTFKRERP